MLFKLNKIHPKKFLQSHIKFSKNREKFLLFYLETFSLFSSHASHRTYLKYFLSKKSSHHACAFHSITKIRC